MDWILDCAIQITFPLRRLAPVKVNEKPSALLHATASGEGVGVNEGGMRDICNSIRKVPYQGSRNFNLAT